MSVLAWLEGILAANPPMGATGMAAIIVAPVLCRLLSGWGEWTGGGGGGAGCSDRGWGALLTAARWIALGAFLGFLATIALIYWLVRREGILHVSCHSFAASPSK